MGGTPIGGRVPIATGSGGGTDSTLEYGDEGAGIRVRCRVVMFINVKEGYTVNERYLD